MIHNHTYRLILTHINEYNTDGCHRKHKIQEPTATLNYTYLNPNAYLLHFTKYDFSTEIPVPILHKLHTNVVRG